MMVWHGYAGMCSADMLRKSALRPLCVETPGVRIGEATTELLSVRDNRSVGECLHSGHAPLLTSGRRQSRMADSRRSYLRLG